MKKTYIQTLAFGTCERCGDADEILEVRDARTEEVLTRLCEGCLEEEGWL